MRIFLAVDFPIDIKDTLVGEVNTLRQKFPELKWIKKDSLHLTLKFLGETKSSKIAEIYSVLENAFIDIPPLLILTSESGLFPNPKRARVYYLALENNPALRDCYSIIENRLESIGIEKEQRNFHPHITLARIKNKLLAGESSLLLAHSFPKMKIGAAEIVLMQSNLSPAGARYTAVQRFSLRST